MKINRYEKWMVNNPARHWLLMKNLRQMRTWVPDERFADIMEIGCGNGGGLVAIDRVFEPDRLAAIELDEAQLALAQTRHAGVRAQTDLRQADATRLPFADEQFDAVFEMTIFHHIPAWETALAEVFRVLKPGGVFFFEDLMREYHFEAPVISFVQLNFTEHPWDTIPTTDRFFTGVEAAGFELLRQRPTRVPGWFLGAVRKPVAR